MDKTILESIKDNMVESVKNVTKFVLPLQPDKEVVKEQSSETTKAIQEISKPKRKYKVSLDTYHQKTLEWSNQRKIIENGRIETQALKLVSEVGELTDNVAKGRLQLDQLGDDIGDCLVVLTNIAAMANLDLAQCWRRAYNDIKNRRGYLNEKGVFIKESDVLFDGEQKHE